MKKKFVIPCCVLLSFILTLLISYGNTYGFNTKPTMFTLMYTFIIFCIILYISMVGAFVITKKIKKEKIELKKIISILLFFVSLLITLGLIITINIDYLNWYIYSSPFYINVIIKCFEFLIPVGLIIGIGIFLIKKK